MLTSVVALIGDMLCLMAVLWLNAIAFGPIAPFAFYWLAAAILLLVYGNLEDLEPPPCHELHELQAVPDQVRGAHHNRALTVQVKSARAEPHEWQYRADTTVGQLRAELARGKKIGLNTFKLVHNGNSVNDFDVLNALIGDELDRIEFDLVRVPNTGPPTTPSRQRRSRSRATRPRSPRNTGWRHLGRLGSRNREGDQEIEVRLPNFTAWTLFLPAQKQVENTGSYLA